MTLRSHLEKRIVSKSSSVDPLSFLLSGTSMGYRVLVSLRDKWYQSKWSKKGKLPSPVISVGNLTVGGSGKTPLVMLLGSMLAGKGIKVAVLSRGYGRKSKLPVVKVSDGQGPLTSVRSAGDEPYLIAKKLRNVAVWVGGDRLEAGLECWSESRPEVFILDDGFQHRRVLRDLDIIVARVPLPWGNGRLLPAGPMREPLISLRRVQVIVFNTHWEEEFPLLDGLPMKDCVFLRGKLVPKSLRNLAREESAAPFSIRGYRVGAFCGIGSPESFKRTLLAMGVRLGPFLSFPDHHWYTHQDLVQIKRLSRKADLILTTEKDACKLMELGVDLTGMWALEAEMEVEPLSILEEILDEVMRKKG